MNNGDWPGITKPPPRLGHPRQKPLLRQAKKLTPQTHLAFEG